MFSRGFLKKKPPSGQLSPPGVINDYTLASKNRMDASKAKIKASEIKKPICVVSYIHLSA